MGNVQRTPSRAAISDVPVTTAAIFTVSTSLPVFWDFPITVSTHAYTGSQKASPNPRSQKVSILPEPPRWELSSGPSS